MSLQLYDTMRRAKRPFAPRDPQRVTMYVCGPTVYNFAHIGNFRPVVVFDLLYRVLRHLYGEDHVLYAANVTDVDDKINAKAQAEGVPIGTITQRYLSAYNEDAAALGALPPTFQPRATETMDAIIAMIGDLVRNNAAYAKDGHVLFRTAAFSEYGQLSRKPLDDLVAGARVDVAPYKEDPRDFVLWKPSKPGEPEWQSPFGPGRPGWHIECTAMIAESLGLPIDIHGGGEDLVFPHHENELAQGVCSGHGREYARYWLHNGFLNFGDEKMSKSLGNVLLAHDLLREVRGEAIRLAMLSVHYRMPLDWHEGLIQEWANTYDEWLRTVRDAGVLVLGSVDRSELLRSAEQVTRDILAKFDEFPAESKIDWRKALLDDLNTAVALQYVRRLFSELRKSRNMLVHGQRGTHSVQELSNLMGQIDAALSVILGVDGFCMSQMRRMGQIRVQARVSIEELVQKREEARAKRDWAAADRIRAELSAMGISVIDSPTGPTWHATEPEAD